MIRKFTGHDRKVNALAFGPKDICYMMIYDVLVVFPRVCSGGSTKKYMVDGDQTITVVVPSFGRSFLVWAEGI